MDFTRCRVLCQENVSAKMEMNAPRPEGGVDGGRNLERVRVWSNLIRGKRENLIRGKTKKIEGNFGGNLKVYNGGPTYRYN